MADLSLVASAVVTVAGNTVVGVAGTAIAAGQLCYKKASDNKYYLADCDATAVAADSQADNVAGIALCSADEDQPIKLQTSGTVTVSSVLTVGTVLYLSNVAGGITATYADIVSTDWLTTIGIPSSATVINLDINRTAIQKP